MADLRLFFIGVGLVPGLPGKGLLLMDALAKVVIGLWSFSDWSGRSALQRLTGSPLDERVYTVVQ